MHPFTGPLRYLGILDDKTIPRRITVFVIVVSLMGLVIKWCSNDPANTIYMEERYTRTMIGLTASLVITRSRHFSRTLHTVKVALHSCLPFIATSFIIMMVFSQLCEDLYKEKTELGAIPPYFSTPYKSFTTTFQLFVGEGWEDIAWDVALATHYGSNLLFIVYVFFTTLLFGQLVLGLVIAVFVETSEFSSTRVYDAIDDVYQNLAADEKERLFEDFRIINYLLHDVHEAIQYFTESEMNVWRFSSACFRTPCKFVMISRCISTST